MSTSIKVEIAPGELLDKISILLIKQDKIRDERKLEHVERELKTLSRSRDEHIDMNDELTQLSTDLRKVNETLWQIEDDIRRCEAAGDFGPSFIRLARDVYITNDKRAELKRQINVACDAAFEEVKEYIDYKQQG